MTIYSGHVATMTYDKSQIYLKIYELFIVSLQKYAVYHYFSFHFNQSRPADA